jgi:hypothetical protein
LISDIGVDLRVGIRNRTALSVGILLGQLAGNFRIIGSGLSDSFHFGEYFVSEINARYSTSDVNFVMIHGLVDVLPARVSRLIFGTDYYFFPTWVFYQFINVLTALIFSLLVMHLVPRIAKKLPSLFLLGVFSAGTVGYRDLFLILCLFLIVKIRLEKMATRNVNYIFISLGLVSLIGMYWTWNRGILGLACTVLTILGIGFHAKNVKSFILGIVLGQSIIFILFPQFNPVSYTHNFLILLSTSKEWYLPISDTWSILVEIFIVSSYVTFKGYSSLNLNVIRSREIFYIGIPVVLLLGGIQWVVGRADNSHLISFYWVVFFVLMFLERFSGKSKTKESLLLLILTISLFFHVFQQEWTFSLWLSALLLILTYNSYSVHRVLLLIPVVIVSSLASGIIYKAADSSYSWREFVLTLPKNSDTVSPGVKWASREIITSKSNCVLDFTNSGLINGLSQKPSCTAFGYLVYANSNYEDSIIRTLKNRLPEVIVWSANYWSYSIDGRITPERFPKLSSVLNIIYKPAYCKFDYCVRKKISP